MSFAIHFHAVTWQIHSTPGLHGLTWGKGGGANSEGGLVQNAQKHQKSIAPSIAWGLCLPWVLLLGGMAQPLLLAHGAIGGVRKDQAEQLTVSVCGV